VTLTYGPQDIYRDAIIGGLSVLAVIALLAAWPGWPPRRRSRVAASPPVESAAPVRWVALGLASIGLGLWLGGYAGIVVVTAAAAMFLVPTRLRQVWIPAALLLTATISGALGEHLSLAGDTGGGVTTLSDTIPQLCCLIVVARLLISLVPER
jgi:arabinofuranan 3-O-arabinosyltransferase